MITTLLPHSHIPSLKAIENAQSNSIEDNIYFMVDDDIPLSIAEPRSSVDALAWEDAMHLETQSMYDNIVWSLADLPQGRKAIECKWIFSKKYKVDGENAGWSLADLP